MMIKGINIHLNFREKKSTEMTAYWLNMKLHEI